MSPPNFIPTPVITMSDQPAESSCRYGISFVFANLILRLWVALRLFMAGVDKWRGGDGAKATFNMDNFNVKTDRIAKLMSDNSFLPESMAGPYSKSIGYILIAVGIWVALGLFSEVALLAAGFTVLSLAFGLAALPDDTEVVYIGIHVLIIAFALVTQKANKISLDGLFRRGACKKSAPAPAAE